MDSFVTDKLTEWRLSELIENFRDEDIDEEAFLLLDEDTIKNLVPKVGPRLKFLSLFREFKGSNAPAAAASPQPSTSNESRNHDADLICPLEESANQVLVLEAVPPLDIRQVLSAVSSGREIINNLQDTGVINRKQRITLTQILVSFLIERFGQRPSTSIKQALALSLVQTFPALNDNSDSGYDIWYTKARKLIKDGGVIHYPATGFFEERLRNVRKRSNRGSTQQMPEASQSRRAYIPANRKKCDIRKTGGGPPPPEYTVAEELALSNNKGRPIMDGIASAVQSDPGAGSSKQVTLEGNTVSLLKPAHSLLHRGFFTTCPRN
ncbi:uncharacterized protein LOC127640673 isoform X2 [Xyrauchen texanus]|uniref:uncharacterized protein LOC127640673 isoform X2 n=2 Tax=Xyrauchen texanus TaxID=154827 RepID=UPI002241AF06|nr:uncharacterized protein LOC127640673 isoform X2 [Xyrauchen texanus]